MRKIGLRYKISIMGIMCLILAYGVWNWTENQINFLLSSTNSNLERMAQVKTSSHNVTRNHNGQLLWQDIGAGEVVYMGNAIQTEKNSAAEIILDEGESIAIGPESLVRFVRVGGKISLDLIEGIIEIKSPDIAALETMRLYTKKSSQLVIKTPQGQLALNNASLKLHANKNNQQNSENNFKIEVISGTPELTTLTEKKVLGPTAEAEKIEVKTIEEAKPEIVTPRENAAVPENVMEQPEPEVAAKPEPLVDPATERQPAQLPLTAPKVKSIKVMEAE